QKAAERLLNGEVPMIELEERCLKKDGEVIEALVSAAVKRDESGRPERIVAAIRDITPRKQTEREGQEIQGRLEKVLAERTSELQQDLRRFEDFCSSIAHDLRAPLRAMHTFANLLGEQYGSYLPEEGQEFCSRVAAASSRMDRLLKDLLEYGRVSS